MILDYEPGEKVIHPCHPGALQPELLVPHVPGFDEDAAALEDAEVLVEAPIHRMRMFLLAEMPLADQPGRESGGLEAVRDGDFIERQSAVDAGGGGSHPLIIVFTLLLGGMIATAPMGDPNASISTPQPGVLHLSQSTQIQPAQQPWPPNTTPWFTRISRF